MTQETSEEPRESDSAATSSSQSSSLRLPRQFWSLAGTEVWERFSFYGLQAILSFYLFYSLTDGGLGIATPTAMGVVGAYGAFVYIMQFAGGWLGDRVIAPRTMVLIGAATIMAGHIALGIIPGVPGLSVGLVLIAVGTGALKTNITATVGHLLPEDQKLRDSGYGYFLAAINLGGLLGPFATGWTQSVAGFHVSFAVAAVGMALGLVQYLTCYSRMPAESAMVANPIGRSKLILPAVISVAAATLVGAAIATGVLPTEHLTYYAGGFIVVCAALLFRFVLTSRETTDVERVRVRAFIPLWIAAVLYYGVLLQIFTTMAIFIDARVDLRLGGWDIPAAWLIASVGFFGPALTPLIARTWKRGLFDRFGAATKIAVGLVIVSVAFLILLPVATGEGKTVSPFLVLVTMALVGVSEVFVNPTTFSLVTRIAPRVFRSRLTALAVLMIGGGAAISGILGILFTTMPMVPYLLLVGLGGLLAAGLLRSTAPRIVRMLAL
ncbi:oligopeptide:H+ symporter [Streptomyces sp. NPDC047971]|uniref:peptide MFS transporter n=1 Tax=Streptomyces sp. NPDC047971 TaxID=3154499 RepID=UPI0033D406C4